MTLNEMLGSDAYQIYESETLLNPQYHMINNTDIDPDDLIKASESGGCGVSHADFINCWREYLADSDEDEETKDAIEAEISQCEDYHEKCGTLHEII